MTESLSPGAVEAGQQQFTQALESVPFGHLLTGMAKAIADSQFQLDWSSIRAARAMAGRYTDDAGEVHDLLVKLDDDDQAHPGYSLLELGFTPTFYQFTDTEIELKVSYEISQEVGQKTGSFSFLGGAAGGIGPGFGAVVVGASSCSASFSAKYNFSGESTSAVKTRLVPLPAPSGLQERLQALVTQRRIKAEAAAVARAAADAAEASAEAAQAFSAEARDAAAHVPDGSQDAIDAGAAVTEAQTAADEANAAANRAAIAAERPDVAAAEVAAKEAADWATEAEAQAGVAIDIAATYFV